MVGRSARLPEDARAVLRLGYLAGRELSGIRTRDSHLNPAVVRDECGNAEPFGVPAVVDVGRVPRRNLCEFVGECRVRRRARLVGEDEFATLPPQAGVGVLGVDAPVELRDGERPVVVRGSRIHGPVAITEPERVRDDEHARAGEDCDGDGQQDGDPGPHGQRVLPQELEVARAAYFVVEVPLADLHLLELHVATAGTRGVVFRYLVAAVRTLPRGVPVLHLVGRLTHDVCNPGAGSMSLQTDRGTLPPCPSFRLTRLPGGLNRRRESCVASPNRNVHCIGNCTSHRGIKKMVEIKRDRLQKEKRKIKKSDISDNDKDRILELLEAYDEEHILSQATDEKGEKVTKKPATLSGYAVNLKNAAKRIDGSLTTATDVEVNQLIQKMNDGRHSEVPNDGLCRNTIVSYQGNLRVFYRYHDDLDIEPEEIPIFTAETDSVDEQDIFDREDIQAMREVIDNPRDRCLFEQLLITGQRLTGIQTMRVKDIDLDKGVTGCFRLNPNSDGLKDAEKTGEWKPLFGAKAAVREWLNYHPYSDDPDAILITHRNGWSRDSDGGMLTQQSINRRLKIIARKAGVEKPSNPHNFRHSAATILKRDYGLSNDFIRWYLGHRADSKVFETTYRHLKDEDFRKQAEAKAGFREEENEQTLTPKVCPTCDKQLEAEAKACERCGEIFAPDAKAAQDMIDDLAIEGMRGAGDDKEADSVERFREFLKENPDKAVDILRDELE